MSEQILLVDDDEIFTSMLGRALTREGYDVHQMHTLEEIQYLTPTPAYGYILLDLMLGERSSLPVLPNLRAIYPDALIVMLSGYASIATTVRAMKDGADNYLAKPVGVREVLAVLRGPARAAASLSNQHIPLNRIEWEHIQRVLVEHDGNVSATARALGIHRRTLQRKLAKRPPPADAV